MQHEQKYYIEMLKEIEHRDGTFYEPHPTPLLHRAVALGTVANGELPTTEDHGKATVYHDRGDLLLHLEELRERHPERRFAIRQVITNIEAWPPLVTGGYASSPNDLRRPRSPCSTAS